MRQMCINAVAAFNLPKFHPVSWTSSLLHTLPLFATAQFIREDKGDVFFLNIV